MNDLKITWRIKAWFFVGIFCYAISMAGCVESLVVIFTATPQPADIFLCAAILCFSYTFGLMGESCILKTRLKTRDFVKSMILALQKDLDSNLDSGLKAKITQEISNLERLLQRIENGLSTEEKR